MEVRFYIDPESELPHISKHGVQESEVLEVLESPLEDGSGVEGTRIAIDQTESGRFLKVHLCAGVEAGVRLRHHSL